MLIDTMLELGADVKQVQREISKLKLEGYHLHAARKQKANIEGVKFDVHLEEDHEHEDEHEHQHAGHTHEHHHHHGSEGDKHAHARHEHEHEHHHHAHSHQHGRNFSEIKKLIQASDLSAWVKEKSTAIFHRIAVAEGKIHGLPPESVHFHEVGAVDSIVDIVGACVALELLGKPRVISAPVTEGTGWINCAHGKFPIPAPATIGILAARKIPIRSEEHTSELQSHSDLVCRLLLDKKIPRSTAITYCTGSPR